MQSAEKTFLEIRFLAPFLATNRAAIGRIWTILWGSKAGPWGHILGPSPAPGGPKKNKKNKEKQNKTLKTLDSMSQLFKPVGTMPEHL